MLDRDQLIENLVQQVISYHLLPAISENPLRLCQVWFGNLETDEPTSGSGVVIRMAVHQKYLDQIPERGEGRMVLLQPVNEQEVQLIRLAAEQLADLILAWIEDNDRKPDLSN